MMGTRAVAQHPVPRFEPRNDTQASSTLPTNEAIRKVRTFISTLDVSRVTWMSEDCGAQRQHGCIQLRRKRKPSYPKRAADIGDYVDFEAQEKDSAASCLLLLLASGQKPVKRPLRNAKATKKCGTRRSAPRGGLSAEEVQRITRERRLRKAAVAERLGMKAGRHCRFGRSKW
jgi:hypothetical protein